MTDSSAALSTLKAWCEQGKLQQAKMLPDGLVLGETKLENLLLTIEVGDGKTYRYSLASVYLQILDPNQGLVAYRNACKQHNVDDPVKAIDKSTVVGFFFGSKVDTGTTEPSGGAQPEDRSTEVAAENSAPAASAETTTTSEPLVSRKEKPAPESSKNERQRADRHHQHKSSRSHKDHRKRERERKDSHKHRENKSPKKKPKEVTNEELFSNLNVVVEKRTQDLDATRIEITKALSADGFEVTPEVLEQYKDAAQEIFKNEIPVGNSASILRAANPRKDLSRVLQIFNETINPPKAPKPSKGARGAPQPGKTTHQRPYLVGKKPVIVVPKGMTAPITLANAHEFFCNGRFIPRDVALKQGNAAARSAKVTFTRQIRAPTGSGPVEFEIMDNPKKLGVDPAEWDRVVAVIVLGQAWQFKDWVGQYSNPVQLFARTFGFFISMEGDRTPSDVATWSVKQARLHRDKRGLDSVTFASFWNGVENWMTVNRREMLPQSQD
ncbi:hypothetical protein ACA910_017267 [Epithemia clementina (nom. ined.)]